MFETFQGPPRKPLLPWVKGVLALWIVTLPITLPFGCLSGMAGDGGYNWYVDLIIWTGATYPLSVILAVLFRRKRPELVFLPCLNIALWFFAGLIAPHLR